MSPYPMDPAEARGPMRIVLTTYPDAESARRETGRILRARLAACVDLTPIDSEYWWRGELTRAREVLVSFKTVPKFVGALFRAIGRTHPYEVPWIAEVDVHRAHPAYLRYLAKVLDPASPPPPLGGGPTHPGARRGRGGRSPARTRAPPRLRSTRTRTHR